VSLSISKLISNHKESTKDKTQEDTQLQEDKGIIKYEPISNVDYNHYMEMEMKMEMEME
jgi:hypothetical protein